MAGFILPLEDTCLKSCAQSHQLYFFPHPPYFSSLFSKYSDRVIGLELPVNRKIKIKMN